MGTSRGSWSRGCERTRPERIPRSQLSPVTVALPRPNAVGGGQVWICSGSREQRSVQSGFGPSRYAGTPASCEATITGPARDEIMPGDMLDLAWAEPFWGNVRIPQRGIRPRCLRLGMTLRGLLVRKRELDLPILSLQQTAGVTSSGQGLPDDCQRPPRAAASESPAASDAITGKDHPPGSARQRG